MLTNRTAAFAQTSEASSHNHSIFQASHRKPDPASKLLVRNSSLDSVQPPKGSSLLRTRRFVPSMGSEDFRSLRKPLEEPSTLASSPLKLTAHARTQDGSNPDRLKEFSIKTNTFSRILLNERIQLPKKLLKKKEKPALFKVPSLLSVDRSEKQHHDHASDSSSAVQQLRAPTDS